MEVLIDTILPKTFEHTFSSSGGGTLYLTFCSPSDTWSPIIHNAMKSVIRATRNVFKRRSHPLNLSQVRDTQQLEQELLHFPVQLLLQQPSSCNNKKKWM